MRQSFLGFLSFPLGATIGWMALISTPQARAVTITEIHYNPPGTSSGLEFVEVCNEAPTVADVSAWSFSEGIDFTFAPGTWIPGNGYMVVCANLTVFQGVYGTSIPVAGAFTGKLDSSGETLVLTNNGGGEVVRIKYSDRGKWPSIPAGTGHTLSLKRPHLDPAEPENWAPSHEVGGTPGRINFNAGGVEESELISLGETWNYKKGTAEFSSPVDDWKQLSFTSSGWLQGASGFGYGDNDDATVLADMLNGYWSVAARKVFTMTQAKLDSFDLLVLGVNFDDGFVAYLNGAEVARAFMPGVPGTPVPFDTPAQSHEAGAEEPFEIPKSLLKPGQNVLAIQGHNTVLTSSDFSLAPRLLARRLLSPEGSAAMRVVVNEFFARTAQGRWVELMNTGSQAADLSGYFLTDNPDDLSRYALPGGTSIPPGGFLVLSESQTGLNFATAEVRIFLTRPDLLQVVAGEILENTPADGLPASRAGHSDARFPDGRGPFGFARAPTPGAPNVLEVSHDIVINEIMYNPPAGNLPGEYIEMYNRGASPVQLEGWSLTKGVSFTFPAGATIASDGYVVVAQNPAGIESAHAITGVFGPWSGTLANSGENVRLVDATGNVVNEVRYHDGGRWSPWSDGGGSSLELIDPRQDNSLATAWDASDESAKAAWSAITYSGPYSPDGDSEMHFLLLDAGAVLLDDVSVKRTGSPTEYIPNGGFEADTSPWLLQGTHEPSRRITTDAHSGAACLELNATDGGDNGVNKIETDTAPAMPSGNYTVSFWTRWIRGSSKIMTRADSHTGASLSRVHQLTLPAALGTPGKENSVTAALKASSPGGNLGPVIGDVVQSPVAPGAGNTVTVKARAQDGDGVLTLALNYRTGGRGDGTFTSEPMYDDGAHGDGAAGDGLYSGTLPAQPFGTLVLFYLEGTDGAGQGRRFPVEAPARTLLYGVENRANSRLYTARLNMDQENESELRGRLLHSDKLVDGSFVFNDEEIYYNVGLRYHGSPWNRPPDPKMFRVRFNEDRLFVHNLKSVNLSRYGTAQNEGTAYLCVQSTSTPTSPGPAGDYFYASVYHNTAFHAQMAIVETVDSRYAQKWFPGDGEGYIFKIPGRRYLDDNGSMSGVDWTTFGYRGSMSNFEYERYRWYFIPGSRQVEDRWNDLVALCSLMDTSRTPVSQFDAQITSILDVEQFLRVIAARTLHDDWDCIGIGNGQNAYIYFAPIEGRWKFLPWDMDHTFGNIAAKLFPEGSEAQISRLVQRPVFRRVYLRIMEELLQTAWDPNYIGPYLTQTQSVMGGDGSGILNFINSRRSSVVSQIPANVVFKATNIGTFAIPSDWSGEYVSSNTQERLRGTAPTRFAELAFVRNEEQLSLPITWIGTTTWSVLIPIQGGENRFEVLGFNDNGALLGSFSFRVLSATGWLPPIVTDVAPKSGKADGGTQVTITGDQFQSGARVFFGSAEATQVSVASLNEIRATTPAGTGKVAVRVTNLDSQSNELPSAFEYLLPVTFVRGDPSLDGRVDISDPIKILGYLFLGDNISCLDAADFENNGVIDISDPIAELNFLFASGAGPAAPYPGPGEDLETPADRLDCAKGL
jgi:hypothetical protein